MDGLYTKEKEVLESLAAVTGEVLQRAQGRAEARTDEDFDEVRTLPQNPIKKPQLKKTLKNLTQKLTK